MTLVQSSLIHSCLSCISMISINFITSSFFDQQALEFAWVCLQCVRSCKLLSLRVLIRSLEFTLVCSVSSVCVCVCVRVCVQHLSAQGQCLCSVSTPVIFCYTSLAFAHLLLSPVICHSVCVQYVFVCDMRNCVHVFSSC